MESHIKINQSGPLSLQHTQKLTQNRLQTST